MVHLKILQPYLLQTPVASHKEQITCLNVSASALIGSADLAIDSL